MKLPAESLNSSMALTDMEDLLITNLVSLLTNTSINAHSVINIGLDIQFYHCDVSNLLNSYGVRYCTGDEINFGVDEPVVVGLVFRQMHNGKLDKKNNHIRVF